MREKKDRRVLCYKCGTKMFLNMKRNWKCPMNWCGTEITKRELKKGVKRNERQESL